MQVNVPKQHYIHGASITPLDLKDFVSHDEGEPLNFTAVMYEGGRLEDTLGLTCSPDGVITGTISKGALPGVHQILSIASTPRGAPIVLQFEFEVHASATPEVPKNPPPEKKAVEAAVSNDLFEGLLDINEPVEKAPVTAPIDSGDVKWRAIHENFKLPSVEETIDRPFSRTDLYYLLERYATLTIWNADVLEPASQLKILQLEDAGEHFHIFDRGSSLVAAPKNLYATDRSTWHAIRASQAMMREAYRRGWAVEAAGFDKMLRSAWVEGQRLSDVHNKPLDFRHYEPNARTRDYYDRHVKPRAHQLGAKYGIA